VTEKPALVSLVAGCYIPPDVRHGAVWATPDDFDNEATPIWICEHEHDEVVAAMECGLREMTRRKAEP
jgi:hypothetical protein